MRTTQKANVTYRLTRKERAVLWAIACWFNDDLVSGQLKQQLYPGVMIARLTNNYDKAIEDRIIELGKWLEGSREEDD